MERAMIDLQLGSDQGQPAANRFRKHRKSSAVRMGAAVEPSQLVYGSAAANRSRKHWMSLALRIGVPTEPLQLA